MLLHLQQQDYQWLQLAKRTYKEVPIKPLQTMLWVYQILDLGLYKQLVLSVLKGGSLQLTPFL
jgi:hypothetical protein